MLAGGLVKRLARKWCETADEQLARPQRNDREARGYEVTTLFVCRPYMRASQPMPPPSEQPGIPPALDHFMEQNIDRMQAELADDLASAVGVRGRRAERLNALIGSRSTAGPGAAYRARASRR